MEDENMLQCPFDPNHRIRSSKFEIHMIKCKKNFKTHVNVCPFNAKHVIKYSEFRHHLIECPDRNRLIYEQMLNETPMPEPTETPQPSGTNYDEECWDDEINKVPVIQPKPKTAPVSFEDSYQLMKKSERKKIAKERVENFKTKSDQAQPNTSTASAINSD